MNIPINQNNVTGSSVSVTGHHRLQNMTIIVVSIAVIFGLLYWWTTSGQKPAIVQNQPVKVLSDAEKASLILANSPAVTQQDIDAGTAILKSSKVVVTQADIQAATKALQGK